MAIFGRGAYPASHAVPAERSAPLPGLLLHPALAEEAADALLGFAISSQQRFSAAQTLSVDLKVHEGRHRRAQTLRDLGTFQGIAGHALQRHRLAVAARYGDVLSEAACAEEEVTASGEGDWFGRHRDSGAGPVAHRRYTIIIYLHRRPLRFSGGELLLYDGQARPVQLVKPHHNSAVIFRSAVLHEILPVSVNTGEFADRRFAMNCWI